MVEERDLVRVVEVVVRKVSVLYVVVDLPLLSWKVEYLSEVDKGCIMMECKEVASVVVPDA